MPAKAAASANTADKLDFWPAGLKHFTLEALTPAAANCLMAVHASNAGPYTTTLSMSAVPCSRCKTWVGGWGWGRELGVLGVNLGLSGGELLVLCGLSKTVRDTQPSQASEQPWSGIGHCNIAAGQYIKSLLAESIVAVVHGRPKVITGNIASLLHS